MLLLHAPRANLPCKFARVLHAVLHGLLHEMLGSLHDTSTMPLAVATEVPGWVSTELGDEMSEGMNLTRSGMHLARLKQCLLLYVNAKFMDGVSFTSLEQQAPLASSSPSSLSEHRGVYGIPRIHDSTHRHSHRHTL